jgi:hypothetical protein
MTREVVGGIVVTPKKYTDKIYGHSFRTPRQDAGIRQVVVHR